MTDGDLDDTGYVPKPVKVLKAYGSQGYVCYNHKGGAGASVMSQGNCQHCAAYVCSGCGGLPLLCDSCSIELSQCKRCRIPVKK